ncbi:MAG: alanine racemase [Candidatus Aminicenantes bacterium]|nr:alanine racemase [Candidatus Aminicenantes bacterium]
MPITRPTLMVNPEVARRNIRAMMDKFNRLRIRLRPHFKTHQSLEVGNWFRREGIRAITVSSVDMAARFIADGWRDVLIALPINPNEIPVINTWPDDLALHLLVDHVAAVDRAAGLLKRPVDMWLKIDTGARRCGLVPEDSKAIMDLIRRIGRQSRMRLRGLLTHAGHTYAAANPAGIRRCHRDSLVRMAALQKQIRDAGGPELQISVGDTPACSVCESFTGVDEVRCGNFVFYDIMQYRLGSCRLRDIAVRLICPVIGSYPQRGEVVVHGGKVHLSAESISGDDGKPFFGMVAACHAADPWPMPLPRARVRSLSQEHGVVFLGGRRAARFLPGDLLAILPVHSCLTADLSKHIIDLQGRRIGSTISI